MLALAVLFAGGLPAGAALRVWFKADGITGVTNGAAVTTWNDASGNGFNASYVGTAPTYVASAINGQPTVRFNAANSTCMGFTPPVQDDFTILCVFRSSQGIGTGTQFYQGAGLVNAEVPATVNDLGTSLNANGKILAGTGNPDVTVISSGGYNDGVPHLLTFKRTRNTGSLLLYVDGVLAGSATGGTQALNAPPRWTLGAQQPLNNFFTGDIAEVKIFNTALTITEQAAEEAALKSKFNVQAREPAHVVIPALNTNEVVVAATTPQAFGAVGDGVTDDSAAFQNAMNAVYNSGGSGGGVVYVPAGNYAFYNNLNIPVGVTLHGDWQDWTKGSNGLVGTTFKVYHGAGQTNGTPFIFLNGSTALRDVNIWYPNQNAASITGYPFTIGLYGDCVVQNVVLVNSYQGIAANINTGSGAKYILSTVIGTPLYQGLNLDCSADISHTEDIRFSPDVWSASGLPNAPAAGGPHTGWMRANGIGMYLCRIDGLVSVDTYISGYNIGIAATSSTNGIPGASFYNGCVSNCATALLADKSSGQDGLQFTQFTLDGDIAINRTNTSGGIYSALQCVNCTIIGRTGTAVHLTGGAWNETWMQFQNCTISNTMQLDRGTFNVVDSTLLGSTQCVMLGGSPFVGRAAFTGCTFSPAKNIANNTGNAKNLIIDPRPSISNALPIVNWTNVIRDYLSRKPARTNLFVVTDVPWGAIGNGVADDTAAIQNALVAAGANGGGIVYLPAGKYHLTNTLDVPGGVELRGTYEMRHRTWPAADGHAKGTVLQPYGGQGTTNGPVAIALEANSGLVGVTISYETQNTNVYLFPPTIQGRGGNVYAVGVCCPNPYIYVDFDTYTCTNHFIYMVDGWALKTGFYIGNGSSGSVIDCHGNWTYWWDNYDSQSVLIDGRSVVLDFAEHNLEMYVLGDCRELMIKNFVIPGHRFIHYISENGKGPNTTGITTMCDQVGQGFVFDAAAACTNTVVNTTMAIFADYADLISNTVAVVSTTNFQGTARFFNSTLFAGPAWDFIVNGGDVGLDSVHMLDHAFNGSIVNSGVFHLVNNGAYITYNGASNFPPYNVTFGAGAGVAGRTNEFIGCYAFNGCTFDNPNVNNPVTFWGNYSLTLGSGNGSLQTITITLPMTSLFRGMSRQATVTADYQYANGVDVTTGSGVVYSSNATNVMTVTTNGVVRAVNAGTATVTAILQGKISSVTVTVSPAIGTVVDFNNGLGNIGNLVVIPSSYQPVSGLTIGYTNVGLFSGGPDHTTGILGNNNYCTYQSLNTVPQVFTFSQPVSLPSLWLTTYEGTGGQVTIKVFSDVGGANLMGTVFVNTPAHPNGSSYVWSQCTNLNSATYNGLIRRVEFSAGVANAQLDDMSVVASTSLTAGLSSGNMVITWPTNSGGATLMGSPVIGLGAAWTPVGGSPSVVGGNYQVIIPLSGSTAFFRLQY